MCMILMRTTLHRRKSLVSCRQNLKIHCSMSLEYLLPAKTETFWVNKYLFILSYWTEELILLKTYFIVLFWFSNKSKIWVGLNECEGRNSFTFYYNSYWWNLINSNASRLWIFNQHSTTNHQTVDDNEEDREQDVIA